MKSTMLSLVLLLSNIALGAQDTIYCKVDGKVVNAYSERGRYECAWALMEGAACFTGQRSKIIESINNDAFNWDEEWLDEARYHGPNNIAYNFNDGPNELTERVVMKRCTNRFFSGR